MKYRYAALFSQNSNGQVEVTFPDLAPHAATFGKDMPDTLHMANDALTGYLLTAEENRERLPQPSDPGSIAHTPQQLVILLTVDLKIARE
ncbi:type II toxin-antitoxin system HicB family antitoxin [Levilactobacillus parabrevis]|uniref:type II toxin-antitoxin system HicB family antitoxin n=1 Tax=Levilactobacillus parabrevis TaxID=357278 RepID=UPI0003610014|nr:hypothetical protein [Levilactobacillus parabrevis]